MLVAEVSGFGGPEVLSARQVPDPAAGPGQAVIATVAADAHAALAKTLLITG